MQAIHSRAFLTLVAIPAVSLALGTPAPTGTITPVEHLSWHIEAPGLPQQITTLWGDRSASAAGVLIKVPGGWKSGVHAHTADEHVVVVSGRWVHAVQATGAGRDQVLQSGSYWHQPAREMHDDRCEAGSECVVLIYTPQKVDLIPGGKAAGPSPGTAAIHAASELSWEAQSPDLPLRLAALWGKRDGGHYGELVKMPSGWDSGLHAHTGAYYGVLVSGTWIHVEENGAGADQELQPGSYVMQPGKGLHIDRCKAGADCILFIYQDEKGDVIWPPKQSAAAALPPFVRRGLPGPGHAALRPLEGDWKVAISLYIAIGTREHPAESSAIVCHRKWIADGRYLQDTTEGSLAGGKYYRMGLLGYSNMDRRYEWVTVDSTNSNMMVYRSHSLTPGKSREISLSGVFTEQGLSGEDMAGRRMPMRTVMRIESDDRHVIDLYFTPPNRPEMLVQHNVYTRIGG